MYVRRNRAAGDHDDSGSENYHLLRYGWLHTTHHLITTTVCDVTRSLRLSLRERQQPAEDHTVSCGAKV